MKILKTIFLSGLLAGFLDAVGAIFLFAHPVNQINISNIFRYIASGLFGQAANTKGILYPFYGLILHFFIAIVWSAVYLLIFYRVFKSGSVWVKTIFFSSLIWIAMNGFVLPACGLNSVRYDGWAVMRSYLVLVFCVSLPICLIAEKRSF